MRVVIYDNHSLKSIVTSVLKDMSYACGGGQRKTCKKRGWCRRYPANENAYANCRKVIVRLREASK